MQPAGKAITLFTHLFRKFVGLVYFLVGGGPMEVGGRGSLNRLNPM